MIDPHIFRAYDIRGKAHSQITIEACERIGEAFGTILAEMYKKVSPTVVLGRDARMHSPEFSDAVKRGLLRSGASVIDIGQTPSPMNYFTVCQGNYDGGLQITASHNPKEDNGIKLCTRRAEAFAGEKIQELRRIIENEKWKMEHEKSATKVAVAQRSSSFQFPASIFQPFDAISPYINHLANLFGPVGRGMKVVIDAGNGVAGPVYTEILRRVGCDVTELYTVPDGTFPNHAADPSKLSTLKELQTTVVKQKADLGLAFDGDGDRLGLVDEQGVIVSADQTLLLLAEDHLTRHPGAPVIFTVSNSSLLETEVRKWGGRPVMCKVGHSFVENAMHEEKALLGGEQSGHFFCGEDYYGFDDAMVAGLRTLAILQKRRGSQKMADERWKMEDPRMTLSLLISRFPKVFQIQEMRPKCDDDKKVEVVRRAGEHFAKLYPVNTLDGARIDFGEGVWAGIRYSNTSPCLSICIEARSDVKLKEVEREVLEHLRTYEEIEW